MIEAPAFRQALAVPIKDDGFAGVLGLKLGLGGVSACTKLNTDLRLWFHPSFFDIFNQTDPIRHRKLNESSREFNHLKAQTLAFIDRDTRYLCTAIIANIRYIFSL